MNKIRRHIIFYGMVQGVGFRYRAYHSANNYGITGWIKNCSDGSVEMEVQGTEKDIDEMILSIEKGHFIIIENMFTENVPLKNDCTFEILN